MAVESTNSRNRCPDFTTQMREELVVRMMRQNISTAQEFEANRDIYQSYGITDVDNLHAKIMGPAREMLNLIARFENEVIPQRTKVEQALGLENLTDDQVSRLESMLESYNRVESLLNERGVEIGEDIVYHKLRKKSRTGTKSATLIGSLLDDAAIDNELAFLRELNNSAE